ncbi:DNA helicase MCM8 [Eurytemora carolleeae]|uniref:DNA helicase MCM8 n=1 Tax=Eurytemora carolleeae TaxID=1294199 RepID=UPI000C769B9E|nr:DNA helicase MCM8 [Eurytemora carolleeae]|eukprot:XP_023328024.1 DNA helicase MCM8-like [Eurytemora affinis]
MKLSMMDTMTDEFGQLDLSRSHMGSGMSQRNLAKRLVSALQREGERMQKNIFHLDEIKQIGRMAQIPGEKMFDLISSLNNQGFLIKKSGKVYQMLSLDG